MEATILIIKTLLCIVTILLFHVDRVHIPIPVLVAETQKHLPFTDSAFAIRIKHGNGITDSTIHAQGLIMSCVSAYSFVLKAYTFPPKSATISVLPETATEPNIGAPVSCFHTNLPSSLSTP